MVAPVLFPDVRAFALGETVFRWSAGVDREFLRHFRVSVRDFVGGAGGTGGKIRAILLWNAAVTPMVLETMIIMRSAQTMDIFVVMERRHDVVRIVRTVQRLWREHIRRRPRWLAVMMALHPRLGENSPLFGLDAGVVRECL